VEDLASIDLQFPGARGRIELSWAAPERKNEGEIRGSRGTVQIGDEGLRIRTGCGERAHEYGERLSDSSYHPEWFTSLFARVLSDATCEEGRRNMHEASMLLRTLDGAYRSAAVGSA
jgi:hypothetical protein